MYLQNKTINKGYTKKVIARLKIIAKEVSSSCFM